MIFGINASLENRSHTVIQLKYKCLCYSEIFDSYIIKYL